MLNVHTIQGDVLIEKSALTEGGRYAVSCLRDLRRILDVTKVSFQSNGFDSFALWVVTNDTSEKTFWGKSETFQLQKVFPRRRSYFLLHNLETFSLKAFDTFRKRRTHFCYGLFLTSMIHWLAKTWIYLTLYVCTERILDSRPFMYSVSKQNRHPLP